ncbi:RNA polymerase sigma factor [Sorangium sp. So ce204]|uniref:RNA polymerase sigma factor n=1 Tax=Sorangium sp. So ce204 TaxID=3133288 RepID=UPI003F5DF5F9
MSHRKRCAPPAPPRAAVLPSLDVLVAERPMIAARLIASGIPARDCEDLVQIVLVAAWKAVQSGRYRPDPQTEPRRAIQAWLHGITWRQAGHYLERACVRREVPVGEPRAFIDEGSVDPGGRLLARAALRALAELPARHRDLLLAAAGPGSLAAYARAHGLRPATAASRLRIARRELARRIAQRLW